MIPTLKWLIPLPLLTFFMIGVRFGCISSIGLTMSDGVTTLLSVIVNFMASSYSLKSLINLLSLSLS